MIFLRRNKLMVKLKQIRMHKYQILVADNLFLKWGYFVCTIFRREAIPNGKGKLTKWKGSTSSDGSLYSFLSVVYWTTCVWTEEKSFVFAETFKPPGEPRYIPEREIYCYVILPLYIGNKNRDEWHRITINLSRRGKVWVQVYPYARSGLKGQTA